jgi:hypothetical protein
MAQNNGTAEDLFDDIDLDDDLLGEIDEDDSEGWVPEKVGEGVQGEVIKVGETRSDFARDGEDPMVPTVTIKTKTGEKYRIIGYGAVLKREMQDADPQVGDLFAIKYFGDKLVKKGKWAGKPYKHFGVAVRRATRPANA